MVYRIFLLKTDPLNQVVWVPAEASDLVPENHLGCTRCALLHVVSTLNLSTAANTCGKIAASRTHGSALPDFCLFGFQSTTQVSAVIGEQGCPGTGPHHSPGHWERHRNEFT